LTPDRQPASVAHTPIAAHVHETLNVHGDFSSKIPFYRNGGDLRTQAVCVVFGEIVNLCVPADSRLITNSLCRAPADAIHRSQRDLNMFMRG
jgi:hypothetical protein